MLEFGGVSGSNARNKRLPVSSVGRATEIPARRALLNAVVAEFMTASLFSLVATSIVAARLSGRTVRLTGPADIYLPCAATVFPQAVPTLTMLGAPSSILQSILAFHTRAAFAARLTAPGLLRLKDRIADRDGDLAAEHAVWNSVCGAALLAVHFLYDEEGFPDDAQERSVQLIRDAIKAIGSGGAPFVRSDSTVFIPGWLDPRRDVRRPCGWRVLIHHQNSRIPGVLENVSRTGMGLSAHGPMTAGQPVGVVLPDGRILEGSVVWVDGLQCGVAFPQPLEDLDPLIG